MAEHTYVERDGDWVWRPPGKLQQVSMFLFLLRAGARELQALCDRYVNGPSGGTVTAHPLVPDHPLVILICADIQRGWSDYPADRDKGYSTERDVGFFVPVLLRAPGRLPRPVNLVPYLFVDSFAAVLIGREIFGIPKQLATIGFRKQPFQIEAISSVLPIYGPQQRVVDRPVITVTVEERRPSIPVPGLWGDASLFLLKHVFDKIPGIGFLAEEFTEVPLLLLKQFRDARSGELACYQSIVQVDSTIDDFNHGAILRDDFVVQIPSYASVRMAEELGLEGAPGCRPFAAVSADLDFTIPFGTVVWP
jgi:hypothetical protein